MTNQDELGGELHEKCADITLEDEEEEGLVFEDYEEEASAVINQFCLVRHINFQAMKNMMASAWQPIKVVYIKELSTSIFLSQFFHELDLQRVLTRGPWTFDQHLLIFKRLSRVEQPLKVLLFLVSFWVLVYDLPVGFMSERVGRRIGDFIGQFKESDPNNFYGICLEERYGGS